MKPSIFALIFNLLSSPVFASDLHDAYAKFSTKPNRKESLVISWMVVPNSKVQATCEAISKDSGLGGFGFALDACSFWRKDTCLIVTGSQTTHAELGHEMRHCYQGSFH
jgi:hypothetical protein